jgi:hypothetical protein
VRCSIVGSDLYKQKGDHLMGINEGEETKMNGDDIL